MANTSHFAVPYQADITNQSQLSSELYHCFKILNTDLQAAILVIGTWSKLLAAHSLAQSSHFINGKLSPRNRKELQFRLPDSHLKGKETLIIYVLAKGW